MSKYTFYDQMNELTPGTTNEWAFRQIEKGSTVLEIGCSIGYLTKNLHCNKECTVDIVEIDASQGRVAQHYARHALLGEEGDADRGCICSLESGQYDYIVILDVLEHLRHAETVLEQARRLLKPSGKLLLSVPNICHNSVQINLYRNKFEYTTLGLLDNTHISFFTWKRIAEMLKAAGYQIIDYDAVYKEVGTNEIANSYQDLPRSLRSAFKSREMGHVYQFLIVAQAWEEGEESNEIIPSFRNADGILATLYTANAVQDDFCEEERMQRHIALGHNELSFQLPADTKKALLLLADANCCISNIQITQHGNPLTIEQTNGVALDENTWVYGHGESPQIEFRVCANEAKTVEIQYDLLLCDDDFLDQVYPVLYRMAQMNEELTQVYELKGKTELENQQQHDELVKLYDEKGTLLQANQQQHDELVKLYDEKGTLLQANQQQHDELVKLYDEKGTLTQANQQQHVDLARLRGENGALTQANQQQHKELVKQYEEKAALMQVNQQQREALVKLNDEREAMQLDKQRQHENFVKLRDEKDTLLLENQKKQEELKNTYIDQAALQQEKARLEQLLTNTERMCDQFCKESAMRLEQVEQLSTTLMEWKRAWWRPAMIRIKEAVGKVRKN